MGWMILGLTAVRLGLSRQIGHDPHLIGLLRVFKNYYPEVIVGEATRGRASPFKVGNMLLLADNNICMHLG